MMEDDFYILLDWDNIGYHEMTDRLSSWLLSNDKLQEIEVRASPSLDGYHIYIKSFSFISPMAIFRHRFEWHDDFQKLCMDMLAGTARHRGDLFSKKIIIKKYKLIAIRQIFPEVRMFKYVRNNNRASWTFLNLEKQPHLVRKLEL